MHLGQGLKRGRALINRAFRGEHRRRVERRSRHPPVLREPLASCHRVECRSGWSPCSAAVVSIVAHAFLGGGSPSKSVAGYQPLGSLSQLLIPTWHTAQNHPNPFSVIAAGPSPGLGVSISLCTVTRNLPQNGQLQPVIAASRHANPGLSMVLKNAERRDLQLLCSARHFCSQRIMRSSVASTRRLCSQGTFA